MLEAKLGGPHPSGSALLGCVRRVERRVKGGLQQLEAPHARRFSRGVQGIEAVVA